MHGVLHKTMHYVVSKEAVCVAKSSVTSQWLRCHDVRLSLQYEHLPLVVLAGKYSTEILFGAGANVDGWRPGLFLLQ